MTSIRPLRPASFSGSCVSGAYVIVFVEDYDLGDKTLSSVHAEWSLRSDGVVTFVQQVRFYHRFHKRRW